MRKRFSTLATRPPVRSRPSSVRPKQSGGKRKRLSSTMGGGGASGQKDSMLKCKNLNNYKYKSIDCVSQSDNKSVVKCQIDKELCDSLA